MSGVLLYLIGASGSGKDSLMSYARAALAQDPAVVFAHRYITRPPDAGGENHLALSEDEFESRVAQKLFPLHWRSHGLRYGVGCELNHWLAQGFTVILNGSRAYLHEASRRYPELVPVLIEVSPAALRQRLLARGRESAAEIDSRLHRAGEFDALQHGRLLRFRNDEPLSATGPEFVKLVRSQVRMPACG
ncbi:MAG: phosphonate metabolism protein/1,5-bisphosphokinase (PRPP-forming) PhnN [Gallionella sp.]|nr:phosphonate metabolism protein/1,5-bisphosphokinase (PRPP-forming) PhnN [Gallionella sp.]OIO76254.1 MAG: phosphonate metabolism protein/1,5-bisphosphokinase (PRPP-forming) PhnN [Gallionellaceae bacterium CG1_02_56_997]PIR09490.1 MAG: phosphonate metabolism protein/1,5-bisphosphokinase (PRPP-forming) PhnN [Gallionellaceae bacterium CG11_big_fil_rev_8_21_14_0_20_60_62]PIV47525.1 MAG: phosphonate metabolism protein/1,5-bisphosphokinase (PRPP-forming) PhnN [Gallionellaceae bacterium CG02_land_8_2